MLKGKSMKTKFKSLFLSFLLVISAVAVVACKKDPPPAKTEPLVAVEVTDREYYENDTLKTVQLMLRYSSTEGTLVWADEDKVLELGINTCEWKFIPADTNAFTEKTGAVNVVALAEKETPQVHVYATNEKVFVGETLASVTLSLSSGDTDGTVEWINDEQVLTLGANLCEWKFTPTDTATYKVVYGKIRLNAVEQTVAAIEVVNAPTKTAYKPFDDAVTLAGMTLKVTYDGGKVETISSGWTVSYQNGIAVAIDDTKLIVSYGGVSTDVAITVSKIELNNPQILGTYTYNGEVQQANIKQTTYSRYFEVTNDSYVDAGTHKITLTLLDTTNFKWRNSESNVLLLDFVIARATLTYNSVNHTAVFDEQEHYAYVESDYAESIYYSSTPLDGGITESVSTDLMKFVNAGEYTVYYYIVADSNHNDEFGQLSVSIAKADQDASVKYAYAVVSESVANIPAKYVSSTDINGDEFDLTDKISFKYYTNYNSGALTTSASGSATDGGAPKNIGTYQVETTILGDDNYNDAVVVSTLVVAADDCFLKAESGERIFDWMSSNKKMYASALVSNSSGLNELVLNVRSETETIKGRVYQLDGGWFVEIDDKVYEISRVDDTISIVGVNDSLLFANFNKWEIPYYLGTFERDGFPAEDTTPNNSIVIFNDFGVVKFTFTYYLSVGASPVTLSGVVECIEYKGVYTLAFYVVNGANKSKYFNDIILENVDQEINSLKLVRPGLVFSGDYARVD